ncbi:Hypothetical predicted protein [Lecanosticta acicola]|uniref:Uncharacterized protein n=1 Tax=Lecanosticta acicola TaxID=111012 RepID=A0AAI8Z288_9PEZI|nr:Hypothetical predicted protein [Lecanosticta acicola]
MASKEPKEERDPPIDIDSGTSYFAYLIRNAHAKTEEDADDEEDENMEDEELLENIDPGEDTHISTLKQFLRSCTPADLLHNAPFPLSILHQAVHIAVTEIRQRLDPELEAVIHMAGEKQHNVAVEEGRFWDRRLDVDALVPSAIQSHGYQETVWLLEECRDEIAWLENETRRLETHCEIARQLVMTGERKAFVFRPNPRKDFVKKKKSDGEEDAKLNIKKGTEEDEEMLDAGDVKQEDRGRYDSLIDGSWSNVKAK